MSVSHESCDNYDKGCNKPKDTVHQNKNFELQVNSQR